MFVKRRFTHHKWQTISLNTFFQDGRQTCNPKWWMATMDLKFKILVNAIRMNWLNNYFKLLLRLVTTWLDAEHRRCQCLHPRRIHYEQDRPSTNFVVDLYSFYYRLAFADCSKKRGYVNCRSCLPWSCLRRHLCSGAGKKQHYCFRLHNIISKNQKRRWMTMKFDFQVYCGEIAEKSIRGTLGSFFQLQITLGILAVYVLGAFTSPVVTSLVCGVVPFLFAISVFFCPESPTFHVS